METLDLINKYTPLVDVITICTCFVLLMVIYSVMYFARGYKFAYLKRSLYFIAFGALANILFYHVVSVETKYTFMIYLTRDLHHFCYFCCLLLYILYIKEILNVNGKAENFIIVLTRTLLTICFVADMLSPLTGFGFHQKDGLWYDSIFSPYNAFYLYAVFVMFLMLVVYAERWIKTVRVTLLLAEAMVGCLMFYEAIVNTNTLTSFTYVFPLLIMMLMLHSTPFDENTGALGMESFESYINLAASKGELNDYMILKLNLSGGMKFPDELGKQLNSYWHKHFKNVLLFKIDDDELVLVIPKNNKNGDTEEKLMKMFKSDFPGLYSSYQIPYKIIAMFDVDFVKNDSDMRNMINYLLENTEYNKAVIVNDRMKSQLRLFHDILTNLDDIAKTADVNDSRVLAYCQPIRNMKTGKFDTAEALMRLRLPESGFIMPSVFIPLAENNGYIHTLTKIMLNKVCKQIKSMEEDGYEFKRISVNFAATEIRSESFCEEILDIIKGNGIDPSKIGIEITESQSEGDFMMVNEKMRMLRNEGMTLYLDDIGTGYSNLDRIVRYDVDVVKFDRFFLLEAEKNAKVVHMMKHLSQAFRDLNYHLLYEGVETEENENLCVNCGADYIQGFKYSKPIPIEEMVNYFEKNS